MSSLPPAGGPVSGGASRPRPPAQVLCRVRPGVTLTFDVRSDESLVGRDSGLAVAIPLEGVSRQHARIRWDGRAYWIEDLKSTNGTLLNGQRVVQDRLRHLDVITLGKNAELIFALRAAERGVVRQQGIVRALLVADSPDALPHEIGVGEATLGRSSACNVVAESGAVSKVHARIERTADQLILQDLGSSNGTFVNEEKVMTALLRDGDVILLAGVEPFRVRIEMGEISGSGIRRRAAAPALPEGDEKPRFSPDWKTRFEWDAAELQAIANLHQELAGKGSTEKQQVVKPPPAKTPTPPGRPAAAPPPRPAVGTPPTPAAAPPRPAAPSPKPVALSAKPVAPSAKPAASPSKPVASQAAPPASSEAPPVPPAAPDASADAATVVADMKTAGATPLAEVRLVGAGYELAASTPGAHVLGRAVDAPLRVTHATVSRTHARIIISDDRRTAYVEHAGGANGTRLNGRSIDKAEALSDGDEIGIGEVSLRVSLKRS